MNIETKNSIYFGLLQASISTAVACVILGLLLKLWVCIPIFLLSVILAVYFDKKLDKGLDEWVDGMFKRGK